MTMLVKKAFISSEFIPSVSLCPLPWAFLFSRVLQKKDFPIKGTKSALHSSRKAAYVRILARPLYVSNFRRKIDMQRQRFAVGKLLMR